MAIRRPGGARLRQPEVIAGGRSRKSASKSSTARAEEKAVKTKIRLAEVRTAVIQITFSHGDDLRAFGFCPSKSWAESVETICFNRQEQSGNELRSGANST